MSSEWEQTTLGAICKLVQYGYTTKAKDTQNGVGFIRGTDIAKNAVNWGSVPDCEVPPENLEKYLVKSGDILITRMGTIGTSAVVQTVPRPSVFASYLIRHVVDIAIAVPTYVGYVLKSELFERFIASHGGAGAVQPNINAKTLSEFAFPLPPLSYQQKISECLGAVDDRITLLRETNQTLEAIAQALFKSWFVDFDPVRAKAEGRSPEGMDEATAALFPDAFEETELGVVPRGWGVKPIGEVVETFGGGTPDTKNPAYWEPPKHNWTTPKDLSNLAAPVLLQTERKLSDAGLCKVSSGLLPAGTLLMSSRAPIGYLAISHAPIAINQGYIAIPPNGKLSPLFMLFWCKANMEIIKARANGSTFMEISKKAFKPIPALVPSATLLNLFETVSSSLFSKIISHEEKIQTLTTLRDTLLPRLISGKMQI